MATTVTTNSPGMTAEEQQFFRSLMGPLAQQQDFNTQLQQGYQPLAQLGQQMTSQATGQLGSFNPGQLGALSSSEINAIKAIGDAMRGVGGSDINRAETQGTQAWNAQTARMGLLPTDTPPQQRFGDFQAELLRQRGNLASQVSGWEGQATLSQQNTRAKQNQDALMALLTGSRDIANTGAQISGAGANTLSQLASILYALGRNRGGSTTATTQQPWYQELSGMLGPISSTVSAGTNLAQWLYKIFGGGGTTTIPNTATGSGTMADTLGQINWGGGGGGGFGPGGSEGDFGFGGWGGGAGNYTDEFLGPGGYDAGGFSGALSDLGFSSASDQPAGPGARPGAGRTPHSSTSARIRRPPSPRSRPA